MLTASRSIHRRRSAFRLLTLTLAAALGGGACDLPVEEAADPADEVTQPGGDQESQSEGLRLPDVGDLGGLAPALVRAARFNRVKRWAPAIFQDVHPDGSSWGYEHDYITNFNYDGDYNGDNNRDNFAGRPKSAYVYYSSVETSTHWFLGYYFFHPTDKSHDGPNDLEGVILSIRRDGTEFGQLESWFTQSHGDTPPAVNPAGVGSCRWREGQPGSPWFRHVTWGRGQPAVYVEPRGHGVKDCAAGDCGNNDGVLYMYEGGRVETPQYSPDNECGSGRQTFRDTAACGYGLIPLDGADANGNVGFYVKRNEIGVGMMFQEKYVFRAGPAGGEANPPWQWAHHQWLENPAELFGRRIWQHFYNCDLNAQASRSYTHQPYIFN